MRGLWAWSAIALATPWLACHSIERAGTPLNLHRDALEEDVAALIVRADRAHAGSRGVRVTAIGAAALEKALTLEPQNHEVYWRAARAFVTLSDAVSDPVLKRKLALEATEHADAAARLAPGRPEGLYYKAAAYGLVARSHLAPDRATQEAVEAPAAALVSLDPDYESGGGHRILGALYSQAPPWPAGVGDLEEGVEMLETAVERYPHFPMNHFFLGDAYAKMGRVPDAVAMFQAVVSAPARGEWALVGESYRKRAIQRLKDLGHAPLTPRNGR